MSDATLAGDYATSTSINFIMQKLLKKAQKGFSIAMVAMMAATSIGSALVAPLAAKAAIQPGSLVKGSLSAVYQACSDLKRYVFTNDKAYFTWYPNFSGVITLSDAELASMPLGGNVTYRPGVKMIKIQSDPKVYAISAHGTLRWVTSESLAVALYGTNWNTKIDDVSDAFFVNYAIGSDITAASQYNPAAETAAATSVCVDKGLTGTPGGNLSAALSSGTPASAVVPKSATGVEFTRFTVRNNGSTATTLDTVVAHRIGAGQTTDFANVYLYDGSFRLTTGRTVNSTTNEATFSGMNLSIAPGETKTLSITADISSTAGANNQHAFEVTKVMSGAVQASGLPVVGNSMSISSATVGSITIAKSGSLTNPKVGQKNVQIGEFQLSAGSAEDLQVRRITLFQAGNTSRSNLTNFTLKQGGNVIASQATIDAKDHIVFDVASMLLEKGATKTFQVYGDIGGGARSGDTIKLSVEESSDLLAIGNTFGFGASVTRTTYDGDSCTASTGDCSFTTIEGGQVTISFNGPGTKDIAINGRDLEVTNFTIAAQSNIEIRNLRLSITATGDGLQTGGATANYTDIKIADAASGAVVSGPLDVSASGDDTTQALVYTDVINMTAGQTRTFKVLLDTANVAGMDADTVHVDISPFQSSDIRNLDNSTFVATSEIVPSTTITGNTHTVRATSLTLSLASTPVAQTYIKGAQNAELVGINLKAGDANDAKVTSITLTSFVDNDASGSFSQGQQSSRLITDILLQAKLMNGLVQLGDAESPTTTSAAGSGGLLQFTNLNLTIPKGQTVTLKLVGNISSGLATADLPDRIAFLIAANADVSVQDPDGNSVTPTGAVVNGVITTVTNTAPTIAMTIQDAGQLTFVRAPDDVESEAGLVVGGVSNAVLGKFRWTAQNEEMKITKMRVTVADPTAAAAVSSVSLYDGATLVAGPVALTPGTPATADFSGMSFLVPKDGSKTMTIKATLNSVGPSGATSGTDVAVSVVATTASGAFEAKGTSNGSSTTLTQVSSGSTTIAGNTKIIRRTKPTITMMALPSAVLTNGTIVVSRFVITADAAEQIALKKITLTGITNDNGGTDVTLTAAGSSIRELNVGTDIGATIGLDTAGTFGATCTNATTATCGIHIHFTTEQTIAAGSSKTYEVRIPVTGADTAGDSLTTNLIVNTTNSEATTQVTGELENSTVATTDLDDASQVAIDDLDGTNASTLGFNFVWSDNSAVPHNDDETGATEDGDDAAGSNDWTNGRLVKVLPSDTQTLSRS